MTVVLLRRAHALGLVLGAQPAFLAAYHADWELGLAPDRVEGIMRLRTARDIGLPIIINCDLPSVPAGPLLAIAGAVERTVGGRMLGRDESITLAEAWRAHTSVPAEVMGEQRLGRLGPGACADLVVLGSDPFAAGGTLAEASVDATLVDGRVMVDGSGRFR